MEKVNLKARLRPVCVRDGSWMRPRRRQLA
jgi:hypothetical protein